jgi:hypothetical protein
MDEDNVLTTMGADELAGMGQAPEGDTWVPPEGFVPEPEPKWFPQEVA